MVLPDAAKSHCLAAWTAKALTGFCSALLGSLPQHVGLQPQHDLEKDPMLALLNTLNGLREVCSQSLRQALFRQFPVRMVVPNAVEPEQNLAAVDHPKWLEPIGT